MSNKNNHDLSNKPDADRAIVVGVGLKSEDYTEIKQSLSELEELVYAAGGEVLGVLAQSLEKYQPATLIGSGKVQEIKELVEETNSNLVVIDHHISGIQSRNLENEIGVRVLDRSQLILDIFALRAQSYEGKLQVELAQKMDQLPRMVGGWLGSLSRQGGGIGTRGPGESALEIDRRRIREKIRLIKNKLKEVEKSRAQHRAKRQRQKITHFALIGYTNSGKSTLLNQLTHAQVMAKDQVFATLDPTTRKIYLPEIGDAVLTDTVGFIRKLPTHLIDAFKATLEESREADVLLHVIDLSNPQMEKHIEVVNGLIHEFGWQDKPLIYVFNKEDLASPEIKFRVKESPRVFVSALKQEGLEDLKKQMIEIAKSFSSEVELFFDHNDEHLVFSLQREAKVEKIEKSTLGTICVVRLNELQIQQWSNFIVRK